MITDRERRDFLFLIVFWSLFLLPGLVSNVHDAAWIDSILIVLIWAVWIAGCVLWTGYRANKRIAAKNDALRSRLYRDLHAERQELQQWWDERYAREKERNGEEEKA